MRIAHVITDTLVGGAQRMLHCLAAGLAQRGHEQLVVSLLAKGPIGDAIEAGGVEVHGLGARPGRIEPTPLLGLRRAIRDFRPEVLQSWMYHADLLTTLLRPTLEQVPVHLWNVRGSTRNFREYGPTTRTVVRLCARFSECPQAVVVNSEAGLHSHEAFGYKPRRWEVFPNGFDTEQFRQTPPPPAKSARASSCPKTLRW